MDLAGLFSKLKIELWQLAGAGLFGGLTILLLGYYGQAPSLTDTHGYVFMATTVAGWLFVFALFPLMDASLSTRREAFQYAARQRADEDQLNQLRSHLLTVLRPEQRHHLSAIKQRGQIAFQAYDTGELDDLCSLRLLQKSNHIGHGFALYVVPEVVWNNFEITPQDEALLSRYQPSWVRHTDMPSHTIFSGMG